MFVFVPLEKNEKNGTDTAVVSNGLLKTGAGRQECTSAGTVATTPKGAPLVEQNAGWLTVVGPEGSGAIRIAW